MNFTWWAACVGMVAGLVLICVGWFSKIPDLLGMGAAVLGVSSIVVDWLRGRK